jgi:MTH538 TIR-like domain (DUF1863)
MSDGAQAKGSAGKRRFAAFISYAHADAGVAAKLQGKLERYRLPKRIAETRAGGEAALGRIFRDREDLAAAPSLSDAIRAAIAQAEALVVICSPDARSSRWVGEEIALFRQLHPDGPVLAALVRGGPDEAFPAPLTEGGTEPLAADLRAEGDGEALGFLKIVAGIAGVPLDALVQRDAQRRLRRVTAITVGALAAMLVMGVMTTLALQARNEAARQRAEAEGLVEYMLTDLRDKLKGVGRLDVMAPVNERAMRYYVNDDSLAKLSADSLTRRARILHAMGEDDEKRGLLDAALAKFREAHRTTAAVLAKSPQNPEALFAHAQSEYWVGEAAWQKNDRATTTRHWNNYLKLAKKLNTAQPGSTRSEMELAYAYGNLCDAAFRDSFDLADAVRMCRRSLEHNSTAAAIAKGDADILIELANRYGTFADVLSKQENFDAALAERQKEHRIVEEMLRREPQNSEWQKRLLWSQFGIGKILNRSNRSVEAIAIISNALATYDGLVLRDRQDTSLLPLKVRMLAELAVGQKRAGLPVWKVTVSNAKAAAQIYARSSEGRQQSDRLFEYLETIERGK